MRLRSNPTGPRPPLSMKSARASSEATHPAFVPSLSSRRLIDATYSQSLTDWELDIVQMSRGTIGGESRELRIEGLQILEENFRNVTVNQFGRAAGGSFVFGLPSRMQGEGRYNGHGWHSEVCVFRGEREIDVINPPMDLVSVVIDRRLLCDYAAETERVDLEHWLAKQTLMIEDPGTSAELSRSVHDILSGCFDGEVDLGCEATRHAIRQSVLEAITPVVARHLDIRPVPFREFSRSMVVRRAREHALQNIGEPLQVIDLCRATGVSRRALQMSFQEVLGINPVAYLRMLRLNGARRMLLEAAPGMQVKEAVAAWGFWHLSRFSQEYREMFGELPSETLRLARRAA